MPSPVLDKLGYAAHIRLDVCPSSSSLSQVSAQQGVAHNKSCLCHLSSFSFSSSLCDTHGAFSSIFLRKKI